MRKTKEYISDVQKKIIELHKLESGFKKRARAVKIPISNIRAIIKNFQSTENVMNLPGRGHVSGMWSATDKKEGKSDHAPSHAHKPHPQHLLKIYILAH